MSPDVVVPEYVMSEADAARLTNRIMLIAGTIREGMEKLQGLVAEAKAGNAHIALGYPSWTAYLAATLGKEPLRLGREERQQLVGYLAGEGMSTRAIAPIVGVNQSNVARDIQVMRDASPVSGDTPALRPERAEYACEEHGVHIIDDSGDDDGFREAVEDHEAEHGEPLPPFNPATGEVLDDAPEPPPAPKVTGLDGKTYTRPERAPGRDNVSSATVRQVAEPSYREQQDAKWDRVAEMAERGHSSPQIARAIGMSETGLKKGAADRGIEIRADRILGNARRLDVRRVIETTVDQLDSIATTFPTLISADAISAAGITREEAQEWADSLSASISALSKATRKIRESLQ